MHKGIMTFILFQQHVNTNNSRIKSHICRHRTYRPSLKMAETPQICLEMKNLNFQLQGFEVQTVLSFHYFSKSHDTSLPNLGCLVRDLLGTCQVVKYQRNSPRIWYPTVNHYIFQASLLCLSLLMHRFAGKLLLQL